MSSPSGVTKWANLAAIALGIVSVAVAIVSTTGAFNSRTGLLIILAALLTVAYAASMIYFLRWASRLRRFDFRLAVTGRPRAGKTVFSLLLYDFLMNASGHGVEFTADSKSAIATYQAIRNLGDEWPVTTTSGRVSQYAGQIRVGNRVEISLEIGDSAGEDWIGLGRSGEHETDYLEWVISGNAIVHVVSCETFHDTDPARLLRRDAEDLRLAARLMRNVTRSRLESRPLLVVVSKMDLMSDGDFTDLMEVYSRDEIGGASSNSRISQASGIDAGRMLTAFGDELSDLFTSVHYVFTSIASVSRARELGERRKGGLVKWMMDAAMESYRARPRQSALRRYLSPTD